jgi:hypothetical protein
MLVLGAPDRLCDAPEVIGKAFGHGKTIIRVRLTGAAKQSIKKEHSLFYFSQEGAYFGLRGYSDE